MTLPCPTDSLHEDNEWKVWSLIRPMEGLSVLLSTSYPHS
jgi:hypothetical protein